MPTSSIFEFEQALKTSLQARSGLSGVTVTDGPPTTGELNTGEWLMLGNARGSQKWKTMPFFGPQPREEEYTIDLLINVVQAINSEQTVLTKRAFALLAEVENELRTNPNQNVGSVVWAEVASSVSVNKAMNPTAGWRETLIRATVHVKGRI